MKTSKKIISKLIIFGFILFSLNSCLLINFYSQNKAPHKARTEIPVTYKIGWCFAQEDLQIDSFSVKIVKSKLSIFNNKSLLSYTVKGNLKCRGNDIPFIKEVHVSEKRIYSNFNYNTPVNNIDAEISITPIFSSKERKKNKCDSVIFNFTNEINIESMHWGDNKILFKCGQFETTMILHNIK